MYIRVCAAGAATRWRANHRCGRLETKHNCSPPDPTNTAGPFHLFTVLRSRILSFLRCGFRSARRVWSTPQDSERSRSCLSGFGKLLKSGLTRSAQVSFSSSLAHRRFRSEGSRSCRGLQAKIMRLRSSLCDIMLVDQKGRNMSSLTRASIASICHAIHRRKKWRHTWKRR